MQHRSATVRGIASLMALFGAVVVGAATFSTWYFVPWDTGGADVTFHTNFNLYQLMARPPTSNSVSGALVLAGLALLAICAVMMLLPDRVANVRSISSVGMLLAVALVITGSLTVTRPHYVGAFGANGRFAIAGGGLHESLLGAVIGLAGLLVYVFARRPGRSHTALPRSNESPAPVTM